MEPTGELSDEVYLYKFASSYLAIQSNKITEDVVEAVAELNQDEYYLSKYLNILLNFHQKSYDKVLESPGFFSIDLEVAQKRLNNNIYTKLINNNILPKVENLIDIIKFIKLISILESSTLKLSLRLSRTPLLHFINGALRFLNNTSTSVQKFDLLVHYFRQIKAHQKEVLLNQALYEGSIVENLQILQQIFTRGDNTVYSNRKVSIFLEIEDWGNNLKKISANRLAELSIKLNYLVIRHVNDLQKSNLALERQQEEHLYTSLLKKIFIYKFYAETMINFYAELRKQCNKKTSPIFMECANYCFDYISYLQNLKKTESKIKERYVNGYSLKNMDLLQPPKPKIDESYTGSFNNVFYVDNSQKGNLNRLLLNK